MAAASIPCLPSGALTILRLGFTLHGETEPRILPGCANWCSREVYARGLCIQNAHIVL